MPHLTIKSAAPIAITLLLGTSSHAKEVLHHSGNAHEQASHQHAGHKTTELTLDHGQRWRSGAPLREGMERIRTSVIAAASHTNARGGFDASRGKRLADSIAFMLTNCRLAPAADANLHILIGRLAEAAALGTCAAEHNGSAASPLRRAPALVFVA